VTATATHRASPTPEQLGGDPIEAIRACGGVGYRDRFIKGVAEAVHAGLVIEALKDAPRGEARRELMSLPGVGPYTADLALIIGARRQDALFLDVFIKEIPRRLHFDGEAVPDESIARFAKGAVGAVPRVCVAVPEHEHGDLGEDARRRSFAAIGGAERSRSQLTCPTRPEVLRQSSQHFMGYPASFQATSLPLSTATRSAGAPFLDQSPRRPGAGVLVRSGAIVDELLVFGHRAARQLIGRRTSANGTEMEPSACASV